MIIRAEQQRVFEFEAVAFFEREMVAHLRWYDPRMTGQASDEDIQRFVKAGIAGAESFDIRTRDGIRLYLQTMASLGHLFAEDPQYRFLRQVMEDRQDLGEALRIGRLWMQVSNYLWSVNGPRAEYSVAALERVGQMELRDAAAAGKGDMEAMRWLETLHPEKAAYTGEDALLALWRLAQEESAKRGFPAAEGAVTVLTLMYAYGSGVFEDPLYAWVGDGLEATAHMPPGDRVLRLAERAKAYAKLSLKILR